jgi:hypothetical protein
VDLSGAIPPRAPSDRGHKILFPSLALGMLIGAVGVAMTSSSSGRIPTMRSTPGGLDATRPADAQLAAFGRDNPQCPIWTNWQKTCSRTGEGGSLICVHDQERPARPSEPFCVRTEFSGIPSPLTRGQNASSRRFCARTRHERIFDSAGRVLFEGTVCHRYRTDRPFNGRSHGARRHPQCRHWSRGPGGVLVCSEFAAGPCRLLDGVPVPPSGPLENQIVIPHRFDPEMTAAFGVFCVN